MKDEIDEILGEFIDGCDCRIDEGQAYLHQSEFAADEAKQAILTLKKKWEIDILKRVASVHCGIPTKTLKRADLKDWLVYEINQLNGDK